MKKTKLFVMLCGLMILLPQTAKAQEIFKDRKLYLNEDGSNYVKFTFLTQAWLRNMQYNPGTTINDVERSSGTDIGIRRYRIQMYGQLTDRVFAYGQFGENNFNAISDRKAGFFVHDAYGEYAIDKEKLSMGMGLSAWSGLSRFSSPSVGSILGIDAPLFLQSTNDVTDQFLRKLSVFAKGKLGRLDYRLALAQPMDITKSSNYNPVISEDIAGFSSNPPEMQWNGYFQYQFKDKESNMTPYNAGTYHGKKKVFNIGAGFIYQKDAMWHLNTVNDTIMSNMVHLAADVFYDAPTGTNGEAVSIYGNVTHYDFGKNYLRNAAVMNPANGSNNPDVLNGSGNGFPMYGTGTIFYAQAGYKFKDNLIGKTTLLPYASLQHADYEGLNDPMDFFDVGVNWLLEGHTSKFTVAYQSRPVYDSMGDKTDRRGAVVAQYQVYFN
ncbi:hypothetical protein E0W68_01240 [Flavobacterium salilacus subsp. salilacus]|uniref:hypothetical protein n=1 Tax=Flavobacterium TaxID=237 RepID=UPI00107532AC|nr:MULTISPECIES: hypothetical protein [Flavobacterium]KAF2519882.1 hypothetical protein E0W68_01240 [Flavobacterium salilacus subsp. salilacus]MBE1614212.1 hypothetical protein [Flavobacterium sp. SaA2.13]